MIQLIIRTDNIALLEAVINCVETETNQSLDPLHAEIDWSAHKGKNTIAEQKIEFEVK